VENWQHKVFQPWIDVCNSKLADVKKEIICNNLLKLIQNNGDEINVGGWIVIRNVMFEIFSEYHTTTTPIGFKCVERIIDDYLQVMNLACYRVLVKVIENFKKPSIDNNISFMAVNMFGTWPPSDQNYSKKRSKDARNIGKIRRCVVDHFLKIGYFCSDKLAELRHAAFMIVSCGIWVMSLQTLVLETLVPVVQLKRRSIVMYKV